MRGKPVLGDRVRELREANGMTQEQLAEKAGLDVKTVRKAEQGKRLDLGTITKLCVVLQTELRYVIQPSRPAREVEIRQRDAVIGWQRAFYASDLDGLLLCYHDDAVLHLPGEPQIPFGGTFRGRVEIRRAAHLFQQTCDAEFMEDKDYRILLSEDTAVVLGQMSLSLPKSRVSPLHYTQILTFAGDLIVDHRVEYDTLNLARLTEFHMQ